MELIVAMVELFLDWVTDKLSPKIEIDKKTFKAAYYLKKISKWFGLIFLVGLVGLAISACVARFK